MAEKEKSSEVKELERMVRSGETDASGEDKDGLKFLEQLMVFMKLKLLRKTTETGGVKKETIDDLEKDLLGSNKDKKEKANLSLESLLKKMVGIENGIENQSIDVLIAKAKMPEDQRDHATTLEMRVIELKNGEYKGDKGDKRAEAESITKGFLQISESVGIIKTGEKAKEQIVTKLNAELAEVNEIKRTIEVVKVKDEVKTEKGAKERVGVAKSKSLEFVNKESKSTSKKVTKVKLAIGKDTERRKLQERVDIILDVAQKEFSDPAMMAKLSPEEVLQRVIEINRLERNRSKMADPGSFEENLFEMQIVYQEQLEKLLGETDPEKAGEIYQFSRDLWKSKKVPTDAELQEKLRQIVSGDKTKKNKAENDDQGEDEGIVEYFTRKSGGNARSRFRNNFALVGEIYEKLDKHKLSVVTLTQDFRDKTKDEFVRSLTTKYSFNHDEAGKLYDSISFNRDEYKNMEFTKLLNDKNYKGYTESLISYLYTVGLREGMNDLQLMSLMNSARYNLAEAGKEDLLDVFKSFENMAFFHDKYFNLGAKEYGEILTHLGNTPLQLWLQSEKSNILKNNIEFKSGLKSGELASLTVSDMHDMMQTQHWAKRLTYTAPMNEADLYKEMIVSHLYNSGEPCKINFESGEIRDFNGKLVGSLKDKVMIDGYEKDLSVYLNDTRWKVGTAQDIWRFTGRNLNILDDIDIGTALGTNKGLLGISKICRYGEQYEFISRWQHEIMGADTFLYDFDWYKDTFGKGMTKLLGEDAKNLEKTTGVNILKLLSKHVMSRKRVGKEEFSGSNLAIEDIKLLARGSKPMTFEEARDEYCLRLKKRGITDLPIDAKESDAGMPGYAMQIKLNMEKWNENLFSNEEMGAIRALPWEKINKEYAKRLGKESIGNSFEDFIKNFSYAKTAEYTGNLRGTDMKDYGGYYVTSAEAVAAGFKAGVNNGSTEALAKIIGAMETYHPYDKNGLNRLGKAMWEETVMWNTAPLSGFRRIPKQSGGYRLPNGDLIVNKFGRWEKEMVNELVVGESLMSKYKYLPTWKAIDVEFSMRYLVGKGILTRADGDDILFKKYGPKFLRSWARFVLYDDWGYLLDSMIKEAGKTSGSIFKYIFSAK